MYIFKTKAVKRLFCEVGQSGLDEEFDFQDEAGPSGLVGDLEIEDEFEFARDPGFEEHSLKHISAVGDDGEKDSDWEDGDNPEFTAKRMKRKKLRHSTRNTETGVKIMDIAENKEAFEEFRTYMEKTRVFTPQKLASKAKKPRGLCNQKRLDKMHPTIQKTLGHIFTYPDSLLYHFSNKNPNFRMRDHYAFNSSNYKILEHPLDWIEDPNEIESNPESQLEKLKAHAQYRQFLRYKLDTEVFEEDASLTKSRNIGDVLDRIDRSINQQKLFKKYNILINQNKVARDNAKLRLDPNKHLNEVDCVRRWHESDISAKLTDEYEKIYQESVKNNRIGSRTLSKWCGWSKFNLILSDGQRVGTYGFTNDDFVNRQKLYLPEGYHDFLNLPHDWKVTEPPFEGADPSMYILRLTGKTANIKGGKSTDVVVTKRCYMLLFKYRVLKKLLFPDVHGKYAHFKWKFLPVILLT